MINSNSNNHINSSLTSTTSSGRPSSSSSSSSSSTTQACAACKYQRRKCNPDCTLAPFFPADHQRQFLNAHRLFGVSNILKIIRVLDPVRRSEAMKSIIFQSNMRAHDPVGGCYRVILDLERQLERDTHELTLVLHHLTICRQAAVQAATADQTPNLMLGDPIDDNVVNNIANNNNIIYGNDLMIAPATAEEQQQDQEQQQQQQQFYDYFYFDGSGGGENNINIDINDDHINGIANATASLSGNSVNNNNVVIGGGMNGNGNEVDMELLQQLQHDQQPHDQQEDDIKPLIDMFDVTHALALGDDEAEVGDITSKTADLDLATGSFHCRLEFGFNLTTC